jgi:hypothetical protein
MKKVREFIEKQGFKVINDYYDGGFDADGYFIGVFDDRIVINNDQGPVREIYFEPKAVENKEKLIKAEKGKVIVTMKAFVEKDADVVNEFKYYSSVEDLIEHFKVDYDDALEHLIVGSGAFDFDIKETSEFFSGSFKIDNDPDDDGVMIHAFVDVQGNKEQLLEEWLRENKPTLYLTKIKVPKKRLMFLFRTGVLAGKQVEKAQVIFDDNEIKYERKGRAFMFDSFDDKEKLMDMLYNKGIERYVIGTELSNDNNETLGLKI